MVRTRPLRGRFLTRGAPAAMRFTRAHANPRGCVNRQRWAQRASPCVLQARRRTIDSQQQQPVPVAGVGCGPDLSQGPQLQL